MGNDLQKKIMSCVFIQKKFVVLMGNKICLYLNIYKHTLVLNLGFTNTDLE